MRKLSERELAWTAQKHTALVPAEARHSTKIWTWPVPPNGTSAADALPPIVGTHFLWDADVVTEEAPLRLHGFVCWNNAIRWYYEPEGFKPLAKQIASINLHFIVNNNLLPRRRGSSQSFQMTEEMNDMVEGREFQVWEYRVSHGSLLIRSPAFARLKDNVDIVFKGVVYLSGPPKLGKIHHIAQDSSGFPPEHAFDGEAYGQWKTV